MATFGMQFDGTSATHRHVPECVGCRCWYTLSRSCGILFLARSVVRAVVPYTLKNFFALILTKYILAGILSLYVHPPSLRRE